ncbi:oligosaccharide flippase family protein [Flavobacterium sp. D11R37]|uniref:lipopolysaccharide biosynthesis protein n=1 Tax=Flavobacterium coralii TaxID=2838017 RepID=UPI001CA6E069|nr:oligosaccharide flippase family protein [Flavobacterium coralii]MBY8962849.1 oligosaccharide flippase family protein [Flavobacterium coralii]
MDKKALSRQVLLFTLINYTGTAIGVISTLFIYPNNKSFLGTVRYVDNVAQLLYPVMVLGASQSLIKFYPALDESHRKKLFNYSLLSIMLMSLAVLLAIPLFVWGSGFDNAHILYLAFPAAVSLAFIELFKRQAQDMQEIAVPTLYEKLIPKIILPILFLLVLNHILQVYVSLYFYVISYLLMFALTAIYLFKRFKPGLNYKFKSLFYQIPHKDYLRYSLYAFAGSFGSLLAFRIDGIIIPELISVEANGSYNIGSTLASTLQIPAVGMFAIYAPLVSGYLKNNNIQELHIKYKEVARLLFFIGAVLYSCILLGVDDLFSLLPTSKSLEASLPVILILGFSVLVNMATGFNSEIITYSGYYRFNLVAVLLLTVINVSLNLWFIHYTNLGITGVAYASFLAMAIFNVAKLWFIYKKFKILPFDMDFFKLVAIFFISGVMIFFLPDTGSHLIDLIYKTGLSIAVNVFITYRFRLVYQVNVWIDKALRYTQIK